MRINKFQDSPAKLLREAGYGRGYTFDYPRYRVDPRPHVLALGYWRHPRTRNELLGGINLHYLNQDQVERLRKKLPEILANRSLRARYRAGARLLPDIFDSSYRTYRRGEINNVEPGTLRYWNPNADIRRGVQATRKQRKNKEQAADIIKKDAETRAASQVPGIDVPVRNTSKQDWAKRELVKNKLKRSLRKIEDPIDREVEIAKDIADQDEVEYDLDKHDAEEDIIDLLDDNETNDKIGESKDYIISHSPLNFIRFNERINNSLCGKKKGRLFAMINCESGETIFDKGGHWKSIVESGWDIDNIVRIEYEDGQLLATYDKDINGDSILRQFIASEAGKNFLALCHE